MLTPDKDKVVEDIGLTDGLSLNSCFLPYLGNEVRSDPFLHEEPASTNV